MRTRMIFLLILTIILIQPSLGLAKSKKKKAKVVEITWCDTTGYRCIKVKRGQSWQSLFPDAKDRGIVMRINRRNGPLYPGFILAVPEDLSSSGLLDYSPFPRYIESSNEKQIIVDLNKNAWGAYDELGDLIRWGPATGGKDWCEDIDRSCKTKAGEYRIYSLGNSNCVSSKFPLPEGGAPMPYCMFFNGGQALHGSPLAVIRGNESHGCVRLFVQDAEWLRYDFVEPPRALNKFRGTKVIIMPY